MAISTTPASGELRLALDDILVGENVRDLDEAHVDNLAHRLRLTTPPIVSDSSR